MNFINYYKDPYDPRTLQQCIEDSEEEIVGRWEK